MSATAEKYSRAISSSNLKCESERLDHGAVDTIFAAGIAKGLGTGLLRIRAEFDSISHTPGARLMVLKLKSIRHVQTTLTAMALSFSAARGIAFTSADASEVAAKLLDIWLMPGCPVCDGRGSIGGYGSPVAICNSCGGSKRRKIGWPQAHELVASAMGRQMEERVEIAQRRVHRLLRNK